jgi:2-dehydro-3-deoxy-D-pentonate aldolase
MKNNQYHGIIPPMVTPLEDWDKLDYQGIEKLINHILKGGVHGLFVLGTTGEAPSLSH